MNYVVKTLDDKHKESFPTSRNKKRCRIIELPNHCQTNFNDFRRMASSLRTKWGRDIQFDIWIWDYFFAINGHISTVVHDRLFTETLPGIISERLLASYGEVWIPNNRDFAKLINANRAVLLKHFSIEYVADPLQNPLVMATEQAETALLAAPDNLTNSTQLPYLSNYSSTSFILLKAKT